MARLLGSFCLLLSLAPTALAANVSIKWHGQSFFEIKSSKGTVVAIDPHNIEGFGRIEVKADVVLISHYHIDHNAPQPIANVAKTKVLCGLKNAKVSNPYLGAPANRKDDEFNEIDEKVKDVHIQSMASYHDKVQGMQRGKNSIFIIDVDGVRIVHLGDLGHTLTDAQVKKLGKVDVLMVPVGGIYTLNGKDAKEVVAQVQPRKYVVPMHYSVPRVYEFLLGIDEFLEDQDEKWIKKYKDNELVVDSEEAARKNPIIAVLSHLPKEEKKEDK